MLKMLMPKMSLKNLTYHKPVLLQSSLHYLDVVPGKKYIDATFGGGGHTAEIKNQGGEVLTIDQDPEAKADVVVNFTHLSEVVKEHSWEPVSGILFDLGVSSHQIDTAERGFSFSKEAPLDMRMGETAITAADIVNTWPAAQLAKVFSEFGEIAASSSLARKIVDNRPIVTTTQLAKVTGIWTRQAFQALRITVNDELDSLESALDQAIKLLEPNGKIVVIAFHSLEDRIVKGKFLTWQAQNLGHIETDKPVVVSTEELADNSRSHSAKLRAFKKHV